MIKVRIEEKASFLIAGRKIWISGQDNEQFSAFWKESHDNGLIALLSKLRKGMPGPITNSNAFGVSCVEEDPANRAFDFFIATETADNDYCESLEQHTIPGCKWAILSNCGDMPKSLIDAEIYAFMEWLPSSPYQHANAPELEVYPVSDDRLVEFWLPIVDKTGR